MQHWPGRMLATWFRWTMPRGIATTTSERERWRKSRLLSIALLATGMLTLPLMAAPLAIGNLTNFASLVGFEACLIGTAVLNRRGHISLASWVYISNYILFSIIILISYGSSNSPVGEWVHFAIPIIFAGLLLPYWTPLVFGVVSAGLVTLLILGLPERISQVHHYFPQGIGNYLVYIYVMMGSIAIICTVSSYTVERAVIEADRTQELQEAHATLATLHAELAAAYARLEGVAETDAITGLLNHRALEARLAHEAERSQRNGAPLAVIFADLDHFKRVNDTWGHKMGDDVLAHLAHQLRAHVRAIDVVARYGGEEFVVLLPGLDHDAAQQTAERLRRSIAESPLPLPDGTLLDVTVSMGLAVFPHDGATIAPVLDAADQAMYRAKRLGRNRVCTTLDADAAGSVAA